jgi:hypothetical protein
MLAGAGGYLGWRKTQQTPERNEDADKVASAPTQPPPSAVPETPPKGPEVPETAVAPAQAPPVEEKALVTPPSPQPEAPALATFRVISKPIGMVSVNGKRVGRSPVTVEVKPGKVNVSVAGDVDGERFDTSQAVAVQAGANPPVSLVPRRLKVTIRGRPRDLKVQSLDTHFLGGSSGSVEVYEGRHTLVLSDSAGKRYTTECQAKPGDELCLFEVDVKDGSQ